jgi:hypothetical protein
MYLDLLLSAGALWPSSATAGIQIPFEPFLLLSFIAPIFAHITKLCQRWLPQAKGKTERAVIPIQAYMDSTEQTFNAEQATSFALLEHSNKPSQPLRLVARHIISISSETRTASIFRARKSKNNWNLE